MYAFFIRDKLKQINFLKHLPSKAPMPTCGTAVMPETDLRASLDELIGLQAKSETLFKIGPRPTYRNSYSIFLPTIKTTSTSAVI